MPKMSYDMQQGTVVRWLKDEGDAIISGEVIAEIETDKATVEMPAYINGVMGRIVVETGRSVPVGELIAIITQQGETLPPVDLAPRENPSPMNEPSQVNGSSQNSETTSQLDVSSSEPVSSAAGEVRASPIARRLARERGIDLTRVKGSGPNGRIVEADILAWQDNEPAAATAEAPATAPQPAGSQSVTPPPAETISAPPSEPAPIESGLAALPESPAPAAAIQPEAPPEEARPVAAELPAPAPVTPAGGTSEPLSRMRQAIARVTTQSKREAPHFYVNADIDMTQAMALRRQINESLGNGKRVTINDIVVKAVAMTLQSHPRFNASFREDRLELHAPANIGIAIALDEGLIIAAVPSCQDRSLLQIAEASRDLIHRAEGGTLRAEEYESTFSISNMGMFDVDSFSAIIYPPNAAVLAIASVKERPVVRDGQLAVAQMMSATLSVDHRVADGAEAARFLVNIKALLEQPVRLLF